MKMYILMVGLLLLTSGLSARTIHRSFKNGYPVLPGINTVPEQPGSFCIKNTKPVTSKKKVIVVTNRVVVAGAPTSKCVKPVAVKKSTSKASATKTGAKECESR